MDKTVPSKIERAICIGIITRKSWLFPNVAPFSFKIPMTLNFAPRTEIVLSIGLMPSNKPLKSIAVPIIGYRYRVNNPETAFNPKDYPADTVK